MENVQRSCLKFAHFMSFPGDGDCSWEHVARKTLSYPVMCVASCQIQPGRSALATTCLACQYVHVLQIQHCITNTLISCKYASRTHQFIANLVSEIGRNYSQKASHSPSQATHVSSSNWIYTFPLCRGWVVAQQTRRLREKRFLDNLICKE